MARYLGLGTDEPNQDSERRVAAALRQLPDDWTVLHSVTWQSKRGARQGDGEADFLILHPEFGIIVLEVKGGDIEVINGRWKSTDRLGVVHEIKNPFEQAIASKHALLKRLEGESFGGRVRIGHAVAFPHLDELPPVGLASNRVISWTVSDLAAPLEALQKVVTHWNLKSGLTQTEFRQVVQILAPTVTVRRRLAHDTTVSEAGLLTLTADQISAFSGLHAARGGVVIGGAGTGKTVLAIARAQQLARDGFRTLLLCFNDLLGADLAAQFPEGQSLVAGTFHSLCMREARRAKLSVPATPDSDWWERQAPSYLIEAAALNGTQFDAVVIDEGQDFAPDWLDAVRCLLSDTANAPYFVFSDPRQELWGRNWSSGLNSELRYELQINLRNTRPIAKKVASSVGASIPTRGVDGPTPIWRDVHDPKRIERDVIAVAESLVDEGYGPKRLIVLCQTTRHIGRLREHTVGPYSFGQWGGNGIPVESISRFKGLESEAVIVVLEEGIVGRDHILSYVGISRARSLLAVIGTQAQRNAINWDR